MTADRPMTPMRVTLALVLVMVAVLLAAGCMGDCIIERDGVIIKLNQDGDTSWTHTIDSGKDDLITDMLQTPDGNYIIAGGNSVAHCNDRSHNPNTPTLIWMSSNGDIIGQRDYNYGVPDGFTALFLASDGSYRAVSQRGIIWKIDQTGKKIWNRSADLSGVENYFMKDTGDFDVITQNGSIRRMSSDGNIINATQINQTQKISPQDRRSATGCKDSMCWYQTDDSGFIYVESIQETRDNIHNLWTSFHAMKTNSDGLIVWNKNITSFKKEKGVGNAGFKKLIQTKDGGYLLAFENEKVISC